MTTRTGAIRMNHQLVRYIICLIALLSLPVQTIAQSLLELDEPVGPGAETLQIDNPTKGYGVQLRSGHAWPMGPIRQVVRHLSRCTKTSSLILSRSIPEPAAC